MPSLVEGCVCACVYLFAIYKNGGNGKRMSEACDSLRLELKLASICTIGLS